MLVNIPQISKFVYIESRWSYALTLQRWFNMIYLSEINLEKSSDENFKTIAMTNFSCI